MCISMGISYGLNLIPIIHNTITTTTFIYINIYNIVEKYF